MANKRQPKKRSKAKFITQSVRLIPADLELVKKAAKASDKPFQRYARVALLEAAHKTLQMKLPYEKVA